RFTGRREARRLFTYASTSLPSAPYRFGRSPMETLMTSVVTPIAPREVYVARQPIVDAKANLAGYELLFRSTESGPANVDDDMYATSSVIHNIFTEIGLERVIGDVDGFINVATEFLFSDLVEALPPARMILELRERTIAEEETIARLNELRAKGFRICVKN